MASRPTPKDQKRLAQAQSAWKQGRHDEAIRLYERLAEKHRGEPAILLALAQCYVAKKREHSAKKLLGKLAAGFRDNGPVMAWVGRTYYQFAQPVEAMDAFEQALRCGLPIAQQVAVRSSMASACERLNDLARAEEHVAFLREHAPDSAFAHFMTGLLALRGGGGLDGAEASLRRAVELAGDAPDLQARAWYELARALDQAGQYDRAWEAVESAKGVERPGTGRALARGQWVAGMTDRLREAVSAPGFAGFDPPPEPGPSDRPVLLVTGHPRSGTTLLEQMLDSHPQVATADESSSLLQHVFQPLAGSGGEEIPASRLLFEQAPKSKAQKACAGYTRQLAQIAGDDDAGHWLIDKNPEAVVMVPGLQRVVPGAKVIVVLRDPRDVVLSCYLQYLSINPVSVNYATLADTAAKYARTMSLWLALRDRLTVPWLEVRYEDVVADPEGQARRALDFMGLAFDPAVLSHDEHVKAKVVRSPTYHAVAKPVYKGAAGRWRRYERHLAPAFETLAPFLEAFGYEA